MFYMEVNGKKEELQERIKRNRQQYFYSGQIFQRGFDLAHERIDFSYEGWRPLSGVRGAEHGENGEHYNGNWF